MKRIIIGGVAVSALLIAASLSSASAADMAVKAPPAPVAAPASWTGFYIGAQGGGGWDHVDQSYVDTSGVFGSAPMGAHGSGGLAGVLVGYNWQVNPNWVLGLEGDWDWTHINATATASNVFSPLGGPSGTTAVMSTSVRDLATIRGRIGYTASPSWLAYVTGGVAFARMNFNGNITCPAAFPGVGCGGGAFPSPATAPVSFSANRTGFAVGGGLEYKLSANLIAGVEYLFYGFDRTDSGSNFWLSGSGVPFPSFTPGCLPNRPNCVQYSFGNLDISTVRARLSYKF
jgi:outer membrane immunogenic protein